MVIDPGVLVVTRLQPGRRDRLLDGLIDRVDFLG